MSKDASFDIVSKVDMQEVTNAVNQAQKEIEQRFDLIVCSDALHYVRAQELRRGLRGLVEMLDGVAFLELFAREDHPDGDREGFIARSARWYLCEFRAAGLVACGTHCYLGPRLKLAPAYSVNLKGAMWTRIELARRCRQPAASRWPRNG